jgi:hypothetical protein
MDKELVLERTIFCTIASIEYKPMVKLLVESFFKFHPRNKFIIFSGDLYDSKSINESDNLELRLLNIEGASESKRLSYSKIKPLVLRTLIEEGWQSIIFLDPDSLVMSSLDEIIEIVANNSLTLTPHILNLVEENAIENFDKILLNSGMYNAGFIGLSPSNETTDFLRWWESRTIERGTLFPNSGLHFDQRWLDLAPGFFKKICILRDPGLNVGYFNLGNRQITIKNGECFVNSSKLKLIHFSGFYPEMLPSSNIYSPQVLITDFGQLENIFRLHAEKLLALGWTSRGATPKKQDTIKFYSSALSVAKKSKLFSFIWTRFLNTSNGNKMKNFWSADS